MPLLRRGGVEETENRYVAGDVDDDASDML